MNRLSDRFEICAKGLREVRQAWEEESVSGSHLAIWGVPR